MSNDLVVQLGAKLDQFTSDMNQAGDIADSAISRIESSFANLNPGFDTSTLTIGLAGAVSGAAALLAYIVALNKNLADMQSTAAQVGLSLADFQGVQFGGQLAGLSTDQINTGLEKSAQLLNDASRNSNSLSKELEANGLSVKNSNGQLITQNQLLTIAAGLISNAKNPGDQLAIAQMLGFTKEWIPLLQQGAGAMGQLTQQAQEAGAVINDETIAKAAQFDEEWRKSSVSWSANMKAALADMLPLIDDLIGKTAEWIKTLPGQGTTQLKSLAGAANIPESGVIHIDADALSQAGKDFQNSPIFSTDTWVNFGKALRSGFQLTTPEEAAKTIPGYAASQITEPSYPTAEQMDAAFKRVGAEAAANKAQDDEQDANDVPSKVAAKDVPKDAFDRAQDQIAKRTADYNAETAAVGLNTQAKTQAKALADLQSAADKAGLTLTDQQKQRMLDLAQAEGVAAQAAATRNQQLQQQNQLLTFAGNQTISILDGLRTGSLTAGQAVTQLTNSLITAMEQAVLLGSGPLAGVFGTASAAGSGLTGGLLGKLFGGVSSATSSAVAAGTSSGTSLAAGTGGLAFPMFASGTDSAPGGMAWVGEKGKELMNVPKGAQIIPNDVLRKQAGGAAPSIIYQIDASGADSGTVARIQAVLQAHSKSINSLGGAMQSAQRFQTSGVG